MNKTAIRTAFLAAATALVAAPLRAQHVEAAPSRELAVGEGFEAFDNHDIDALRATATGSDEVAALARATMLSMLGRDTEAEAQLGGLVASSPDHRIIARARRSLSGVYVRQGRYADAAAVMQAIMAMPQADGVTANAESTAFFAALGSVPPMTVDGTESGRLSVIRDKADLPRIPISFGHQSENAILDTGAAISTITVSLANEVGLRQLGGAVEVGGSTTNKVSAGLAYAPTVTIGDRLFTNVPFAVVPDESMSFPEFDYSVSLILGLPLISRLGNVTISSSGAEETLSFEPSGSVAQPDTANLITSGWELVALLRLEDSETRQRFQLDTGARKSSLFELALEGLPSLRDQAISENVTIGGLGGTEEREVLKLPQLAVQLGGETAMLADVTVNPDYGSFRHGTLGQDVLRQFATVVFDFGSMTLEVSNPR